MQKITTFLTFEKDGKAAVDFYVSIFKNSKLNGSMVIPGTGHLTFAMFTLDGEEYNAMDAGPTFKFSEGISLFVTCQDQSEVDYFWDAFINGGGEASGCGWLKDKWGVSWQIIPARLGELMQDPDQAKAGKAMQAMLKMDKIIVADLEAAFNS